MFAHGDTIFIMEIENWLGRDQDEIAMAMDRRPVMERIKESIEKFVESRTKRDPIKKSRSEAIAKMVEDILQQN